ncbi:polysaccharide biosynthesis tyrosine autokinase [Rhizobium gallicum]|uniref:polysaccharide biosynthesis tyrosine autokinase n=1 Tax=Rhizobium gallicum TaxID=56730 RepID=UPI001EF959E2|nr:polysaccharide biosynthesis tyrosine autokinase [Rhizobium gallicum]ULJ74868.1 polysaccharide biosynthesis tyrosine autokinase [Rhizobium gallicum]
MNEFIGIGKAKKMQEAIRPYLGQPGTAKQPEAGDERFIDVDRLIQIARRQAKLVVLFAAIGLLLGVTRLVFATYYYTAGTSVLIDDNLSRFAGDVSPAPANMESDKKIMSQVAILRSSSLAAKVVDRQQLYEKHEFVNPPLSVTQQIKGLAKMAMDVFAGKGTEMADADSLDARKGAAVAVLMENLRVEQQPQSFVIDLYYTSTDPTLSAQIANAYAEAYLSDKLDANFDASQRATVWLRARLTDLKDQSQEAALKVERYRTENGLTSAKGALLSEEQLSDISGQYILAQADSAKALALYNQYKAIVAAGQQTAVDNAATVSEQQGSTVIATLRARYLAVTKRAQEIEGRFGPEHPQAITLRREQDDIGRQIFLELKQMTESYRNQYEVAVSREASLKEGLSRITGQTSAANESLVQLKDLERNAEAISDLYKTYLTKYQETAQNQSFPISEARVISPASPPTEASSPKRTLTLGGSLMLGAIFGIGLGLWREIREGTFRLGDEFTTLGLKFLGYLPPIPGATRPSPDDERKLIANPDVETMRFAVKSGGTKFTETLRHAKIVTDTMLGSQNCKVIGVVSVLPGEGKTTIAANFATLVASSPAKVLMIDADLRRGSLTQGLGIRFETGWTEALAGTTKWQDTLVVDPQTGASLLATPRQVKVFNTSELISGPSMATLLEEARSMFDYIIVDLPPIGPVFDAKAFEPLADGFLLVSEWGATPRALLKSTLEQEPAIAAKLLGVVLNKADQEKLSTYGGLGSSEKLYSRYASYYLEHGEPIMKARGRRRRKARVHLSKEL